jgi:periplasmic divalent cation tolerance protein
MSTDTFELQSTWPDEATARAAAIALVEARLVACAQIVGIGSVYRWQGAVEAEPEWLLTAKTTAACLPALEATIRARHPYDVPQITALAIEAGSADYIDWIKQSCEAPG